MKKFSTLFVKCSFLLLILVMFSSCKNEELIQRGDSLQVAFKKAMALYQSEDYQNSIDAFKTVLELGRGTDYGQEAQFYLAQSYFKNERYLLASSEYERYISQFPQSDKRQKAQFQEALSYYHLSPRYKLSQKHTRQAIESFRLYNSRYPNSQRANKVSKYISELRAKLAKKHYNSADLYMRTDKYEAAITYYDLTIDQYPETMWAQRSLVGKIQAYNTYASRSVPSKQQERYQKAVSAYETFIQLFPNGKFRTEADNLVDQSRAALADLPEGSQADTTTASVDASGN